MDPTVTPLDRRDLLRNLAVLLGAAVSSPVTSAMLASAAAPQVLEGERWLATDRLQLVGALAERVLPRTDTPGALDAGVDRYIDTIVGNYFSAADRDLYVQGLEAVERRTRARFAAPFVECDEAQQNAIVAELDRWTYGPDTEADRDRIESRFFRFHKELTVVGFYTSEVGRTQELREWPYGKFDADLKIGPNDKAFV